MINTDDFNPREEEQLYKMAIEFNRLFSIYKNRLTEFSYYDLYEKQGEDEKFSLYAWKEFYLDKRVQKWYSEELELALTHKLQTLAKEAGQNHSTATNQTLNNLLKYKNEKEISQETNKYFVYSHIPLTDTEEHLENVKTIENIPKEIDNAITTIKGDEEN